MERGLYIAASGMLSEMVRQDQLANDLANASTPGYKADRSSQRSFGEMLLTNSATGQPIGSLGLGARIGSITTDMTPGPIRDTGEPLDLAIAGEGFFGVQTPQGVRYTRNGQFTADGEGYLVTREGHRVLGQGGGPIRVGNDGKVDPRQVGVFSLTGATKVGENMFTGAAGGQAGGRVRAGALEGSGADPARTMVDLIASFRAFESGQRVVRTIDETLQKASTQVGTAS